jgi:hypothetical protein
MFQIQNLLPTLVTTLVAGDARAFLPDFDGGGLRLDLHGGPGLDRDRVPVRPHPFTLRSPVDNWRA